MGESAINIFVPLYGVQPHLKSVLKSNEVPDILYCPADDVPVEPGFKVYPVVVNGVINPDSKVPLVINSVPLTPLSDVRV